MKGSCAAEVGIFAREPAKNEQEISKKAESAVTTPSGLAQGTHMTLARVADEKRTSSTGPGTSGT
jgi:hypothetical protein